MSLPAVAWEDMLDKVFDTFLYAPFCAGTVSGGVVCELNFPCELVLIAVNVFFYLRDLSIVSYLGDEKQDIGHAISFVDMVCYAS